VFSFNLLAGAYRDEQMSKKRLPFSQQNDEQMSNWLAVEYFFQLEPKAHLNLIQLHQMFCKCKT